MLKSSISESISADTDQSNFEARMLRTETAQSKFWLGSMQNQELMADGARGHTQKWNRQGSSQQNLYRREEKAKSID